MKVALLVLALLLVGCSPAKLTRSERVALFANAACTFADIMTTEMALLHGFEEGNPMLRKREIRVPFLLLSSAAIAALGEAFDQRVLFNGGKAVLHCGAAGWNVNNVISGSKQGDSF